MIARAYAKINWFLQVTGIRANGYHELEMIMQHIDLYDELNVKILPHHDIIFEIENSDSLITDENNLIIKAANLLREESQIYTGIHIKLNKHIPIGAGLGGGSADAAAILHTLNHLYHLNYTLEKLQYLGQKIGADVPYCLEESPAIVSGIGEQISAISFSSEKWLVLLKPKESLSTKAVFSQYTDIISNQKSNLQKSLIAIKNNNFSLLNVYGGNSLEAAAISLLPKIEIMKSSLIKEGALFSQMSGSGSAVFGVFKTKFQALNAWAALKDSYETCILTKTILKARAIPSEQSDVYVR